MDNTDNYETKAGTNVNYPDKQDDVVGMAGVEVTADYIDEKGEFTAVTPADAPAVLTWNNLSVSTKPSRGKLPKSIINNINGAITGGLWGIMGASGNHFFLIHIFRSSSLFLF